MISKVIEAAQQKKRATARVLQPSVVYPGAKLLCHWCEL